VDVEDLGFVGGTSEGEGALEKGGERAEREE
jgi:hypothetical protein